MIDRNLRSIFATLFLAASVGCSGGAANEPGATGPTGDTPGSTGQTVYEPAPTKPVETAKAPAEAPIPELQFPQDEAFRKEQPSAGEPRSFQLPQMASFKLKNGIQVYLVEQHQLPTVTMELEFDGGTITDPKGKEGLAMACMDLVTEGTQKLDKLAFEEALADTASSIFSGANSDRQSVTMLTLSKHFAVTHALFVDVVLTPGLRSEDLKRLVDRRREELKQARATPTSLAFRVSSAVLYGEKHPRGRLQTDDSLQAITVDDCKAFHQKYFKPRGARLFVVGDMTEAQIRQYFDNGAIGKWKGRTPRQARQPKPKSMAGKVFLVDVDGAAQSTVLVMHFGPQRKARDYMATEMMSEVLGGSFASRMNMNLREDKGYSYGARSGFQYSRDYGYFYSFSSVRSDSTYQTVIEMRNEIQALHSGERPATEAELSRSQNGAILGLPGDFETARQALGRYRELVYFGLPLSYFNTYVAKVKQVDLKQVQKSAAKHLDLDGAKIIVVGDADAPMIHRVDGKDVPFEKDGAQLTLEQSLQVLLDGGKLGKLVRLDEDGNPIQ